MKQRFFGIALLALTMFITSCTKSEIDDITSTLAGEQISVTATIAGSDATRVSLTPSTDDNNPYIKVAWNESGEEFAVINGEAKTIFTQTEGNTFTGTLPAGKAKYSAFYPASAATDAGGFAIDLTTQTGKLDESKTYMVTEESTDGLTYEFHHATSLLRPTFKVDDITLSNAEIKKVVVKNTSIVRSYLYKGSSSANVTYGDITIERTPEADDIYIYLNKAYDAGESIDVWVTTSDNKWYKGSITVPEGKELRAGNLYTPTVVLTQMATSPDTIIYYADEKKKVYTGGYNVEHTFADGVGRITRAEGEAWTTLPSTAFKDFTVTKVILPETITNIDANAFYSCPNLVEVVMPTTGAGYTISSGAFNGCSNLSTIDLTKAISVGQNAFRDCTSLVSVDLASATTIYPDAFNNCSALTTVNIPNVTDITDDNDNTTVGIGQSAFRNCTNLANVTMPSGDSYTGAGYSVMNNAFLNTAITTIDLSKLITTGAGAFNECKNLQSVIMPTTEYTLASQTFWNCTALANIDLSMATELGYYCFNSCTALTEVDLSSVTTVGGQSFQNCSSLKSVYMGENISLIKYRAFSSCSSLTSVTINRTTPPAIDGGDNGYYHHCFGGSSTDLKIYVPSSAVDTYKGAWATYPSSGSSTKWGNGDINSIIQPIPAN